MFSGTLGNTGNSFSGKGDAAGLTATWAGLIKTVLGCVNTAGEPKIGLINPGNTTGVWRIGTTGWACSESSATSSSVVVFWTTVFWIWTVGTVGI